MAISEETSLYLMNECFIHSGCIAEQPTGQVEGLPLRPVTLLPSCFLLAR